ncbi:TDT family transporter [Pokkaliibacter sp. CJK22405]|uniref:TDT family transporter n=1 Tax=Pokkaliibacter sp. CJK22405 TaxID=3384615 RepID=UPI003984CF1F
MTPLKRLRLFATAPTPMAGLALGIGSLGWCWESAGDFHGWMQSGAAALAAVLLLILTLKFLCQPRLLLDDLAHPVVGSVVPTFAMATMVVSRALGLHAPALGAGLWLFAVMLHLAFLTTFLWHRSRAFELHHMVPSWFVPPVGIIVACVATPGGVWLGLSQWLLWLGIISYAILLPWMLYRLMFSHEVPDAAKPTIAILAAPASLSLAGYLTVIHQPDPVLVALLFGIAVLMTAVIYLAFIKLLRLPFSPGYAAFTFPMVIGATAQFKTAHLLSGAGFSASIVEQVQWLAELELIVATLVVSYVAVRYLGFYLPRMLTRTQPA